MNAPSTPAFSSEEPSHSPLGAAEMRQLRKEFPGEGIHQLLAMFRDEGELRLDQLTAANERQDDWALRRAAHGLRGAAANFGARRLQELCLQVESSARAADFTASATLLQEIQNEYRVVETALQGECQPMGML